MMGMSKAKLSMMANVIVLLFAASAAVRLMFMARTGLVMSLVGLVVFLGALFLLTQRDTYLPFLGRAAFPMTAIVSELVPKNADTTITIEVPSGKPGDRIIYWGARPNQRVMRDPWSAYGNWENTGVAVVDKNGFATLRFHCPGRYNVSWGKTLVKHLHYRVCCQQGMLGRVETIEVSC